MPAAPSMTHDQFVDILHQLCPEKREETNRIISDNSIAIIDVSLVGSGTDMTADLTGQIRIGYKKWKYLYGFMYSLFRIYDVMKGYVDANPEAQQIPTDIIAPYIGVLKWSIEQIEVDPPEELPNPNGLLIDAPSRVAHDLSIMAIGFVLLHEIGHIHLSHFRRHYFGEDSRDLESEADRWAVNYGMSNINDYANMVYPDDPMAQKKITLKRHLAAVMFYAWLLRDEIIDGWSSADDHPPMRERVQHVVALGDGSNEYIGWILFIAFWEYGLRPADTLPASSESIMERALSMLRE